MGKQIAVLDTKMDEVRRDHARLEGAVGEHGAQIAGAAEKASEALALAKQALEAAKKPAPPIQTGPHPIANGRGRDFAIGGTAAAGGAGIFALVEFIVRLLTQ